MAIQRTAAGSLALTPRSPIDRLREDVLAGLARPRKQLPCKYFYDEAGSVLFESICELPEYYLTRAELSIMRRHAGEMAEELKDRCLLIEYGSGSSVKTPLLLEKLCRPTGYIPVDISRSPLLASAKSLASQFPRIEIRPVWADFTGPFDLPEMRYAPARRCVYFPGSTIGNFGPGEAAQLLEGVAELCSEGGGLILGVDPRKPAPLIEPAYNDAQGVTAAFNLNLLIRINRELGADFVPTQFSHLAYFNETASRIEMHLVSKRRQTVHLGGTSIQFAKGETIHTESSYKYTPAALRKLAAEAGLTIRRTWQEEEWFSVHYMEVAS